MTKENKRYVVSNNICVAINDVLFIKNPIRICDVVRVKDIYISISSESFRIHVESLQSKDFYDITFNEILGHVILEEGVDLYEYFKRK